MAGIVPVFILLSEASIYTFLEWRSISSIWSCGAGHGRLVTTDPSNSGWSLRSLWTSFLPDRGGGNASKTSWYFWMRLLRWGSRFMLPNF